MKLARSKRFCWKWELHLFSNNTNRLSKLAWYNNSYLTTCSVANEIPLLCNTWAWNHHEAPANWVSQGFHMAHPGWLPQWLWEISHTECRRSKDSFPLLLSESNQWLKKPRLLNSRGCMPNPWYTDCSHQQKFIRAEHSSHGSRYLWSQHHGDSPVSCKSHLE